MRHYFTFFLTLKINLLYYTAVLFIATIAQLVERLTCNEVVAGSTPAGGSTARR